MQSVFGNMKWNVVKVPLPNAKHHGKSIPGLCSRHWWRYTLLVDEIACYLSDVVRIPLIIICMCIDSRQMNHTLRLSSLWYIYIYIVAIHLHNCTSSLASSSQNSPACLQSHPQSLLFISFSCQWRGVEALLIALLFQSRMTWSSSDHAHHSHLEHNTRTLLRMSKSWHS